MADDATRRQRVIDAFADGATRSWTIGSGQNQLTFTVANLQLRDLGGFQVVSVDLTISRAGVVYFADRVNMPNPANAVRSDITGVIDNPLQAVRKQLLDSASAVTSAFTVVHDMRDGSGGFLGDTLSVRTPSTDGIVESGPNSTYSSVRAGIGLSADTASANDSFQSVLSAPFYAERQAFFSFDTSTLGASATVSAAVFTLYATGTAEADANNLTAEARVYDWSGGGLTTADWRNATNYSAATLFATFDVGTWDQTADTANNFTSDAGAPALVSLTGTTYLMTGMSNMAAGTAPTGSNGINIRMANTAGTASDALLTVTYTLPSAGAMSLFMLLGVG